MAGVHVRALARRFDVPRGTVHGWWARFRARSPTLLAEVVEVAIGLDPAPLDLRLSGAAAVFEPLEQTFRRAQLRFGERVGDVWRLWTWISGGKLLATNISAPWRTARAGGWMTPFLSCDPEVRKGRRSTRRCRRSGGLLSLQTDRRGRQPAPGVERGSLVQLA
jgi:hypothetical protein